MAEAVDWNDEEVLDIEGVEAVLKTALSGTLSGDVAYDEDKSDGLSASIVDSCLKGLQGLGRPFKFVVTCVLTQKTGAGMHTAASTFWDAKRDGLARCSFENATLRATVVVFGAAIHPSPQEAPPA